MPEPHRAAIYYAPEADDPLWRLGCAWLGRDPATGDTLARPPVAGAADTSAAPRRYGFHATLKAPMALRHGLDALAADAAALAARHAPFDLPPLEVRNLHGFLALCLAAPCPAMQALAEACVVDLDRHRVPEGAAEQARRAAGRPAAQQAHVARWGYPLVLDQFLFHMTLTNRLDDNKLLPAARDVFAEAARLPRRVRGIALYVEAAPGAPFRLVRRFPLGG